MVKKILVTGALGYIGSALCVQLIKENYEVVAIDNLSNTKVRLSAMSELVGQNINAYSIDLTIKSNLFAVFNFEKDIDLVIHLADFQSLADYTPMEFYTNNIQGTINLIELMKEFGVKQIIFASSSSLYQENSSLESFSETDIVVARTPYEHSKLFNEQILMDVAKHNNWNLSICRYGNPIGYHTSGQILCSSKKIFNLLPSICDCIKNSRSLTIYGKNWQTVDGTAERDYIYLGDLINAKLLIIKNISGQHTYNISSGEVYSVLQVINKFEEVQGGKLNYHFEKPRIGDRHGRIKLNCQKIKDLGFSNSFTIKDALATIIL